MISHSELWLELLCTCSKEAHTHEKFKILLRISINLYVNPNLIFHTQKSFHPPRTSHSTNVDNAWMNIDIKSVTCYVCRVSSGLMYEKHLFSATFPCLSSVFLHSAPSSHVDVRVSDHSKLSRAKKLPWKIDYVTKQRKLLNLQTIIFPFFRRLLNIKSL